MAQGKAQPDDVVKLAKGEGIFTDYETGFEVFNENEAKLGKTIGKATNLAIASGGLLIVSSSAKAASSKKTGEVKSDLPEDFPGRNVLVKAGVGLKEINAVPEDKREEAFAEIKGIGQKTVEAILAYLKK